MEDQDCDLFFWSRICFEARRRGELDKLFNTCRLLLNNRNNVFHRSVCHSPSKIVADAGRMCDSFVTTFNDSVGDSESGNICWQRASLGAVQVNVDVTWDGQNGMAGLGAVARSSEGIVLWSISKRVPAVSVLHDEVLAIQSGLEVAVTDASSSLVVAIDSLLIVNEIAKAEGTCWQGGAIISDSLHLAYFSSVSFKHVRRQASIMAHDLSKDALL